MKFLLLITLAFPLESLAQISLTVATAGQGSGIVGGPSCASASYVANTSVVCAAFPAAASTLAGWTGTGNASSCTGKTGNCAFSLTAASTVVANFNGTPGHQVLVQSIGPGCVNSNSCGLSSCTCNFHIYRASCTTAGSCPTPGNPPGAPFTEVTSNVWTSVGSAGTSMAFSDVDTALKPGTIWAYTVTSQWTVQTPPTPQGLNSGTTVSTIPGAAALAHQAVLNYTSPACTTTTPCWPQLWRATCSTASSCPTYSSGSFAQISSATLTVNNTTPSGATWQFTDADPALADNTTYVYVATSCYQASCQQLSPGSAPWSGTTTGVSVPLAPAVGSGNSVDGGTKRFFRKLRNLLRGKK